MNVSGSIADLLVEAAPGHRDERAQVDEAADRPPGGDERDRCSRPASGRPGRRRRLVLERLENDVGVGDEGGDRVVAREVGRDDAMPARLELRRQPLPAPGAVPRPVDQREGAHEVITVAGVPMLERGPVVARRAAPARPAVHRGDRAPQGAGRRGRLEHARPRARRARLHRGLRVAQPRRVLPAAATRSATSCAASGRASSTTGCARSCGASTSNRISVRFEYESPRRRRPVVAQPRQRALGVRRARLHAPPRREHQRLPDRRERAPDPRRAREPTAPTIGPACSRSPPSRPYALRALVELARLRGGGPVPIGELARRRDIPVQFLEQLFAVLRRAGILQVPARRQGRLLVRPRARPRSPCIEIVELLDGPLGAGAEGMFAEAAEAARAGARGRDDRRRRRAREPRGRRDDVLHLKRGQADPADRDDEVTSGGSAVRAWTAWMNAWTSSQGRERLVLGAGAPDLGDVDGLGSAGERLTRQSSHSGMSGPSASRGKTRIESVRLTDHAASRGLRAAPLMSSSPRPGERVEADVDSVGQRSMTGAPGGYSGVAVA